MLGAAALVAAGIIGGGTALALAGGDPAPTEVTTVSQETSPSASPSSPAPSPSPSTAAVSPSATATTDGATAASDSAPVDETTPAADPTTAPADDPADSPSPVQRYPSGDGNGAGPATPITCPRGVDPSLCVGHR